MTWEAGVFVAKEAEDGGVVVLSVAMVTVVSLKKETFVCLEFDFSEAGVEFM